jgi:hypothetical protein
MSDPRFRPREMAAPPHRRDFGKVQEISWLEGTTEAEASRIAAARLQHALAVKITGRLKDKRLSIRSYAELAEIGYDRMAKVLRGEAVMRLEDVSDAERLLGAIAAPLLEETRSLEAGRMGNGQFDTGAAQQPERASIQPSNQGEEPRIPGSARPLLRRLEVLLQCFAKDAELTVRWSPSPADTQTYFLTATGPSAEVREP